MSTKPEHDALIRALTSGPDDASDETPEETTPSFDGGPRAESVPASTNPEQAHGQLIAALADRTRGEGPWHEAVLDPDD